MPQQWRQSKITRFNQLAISGSLCRLLAKRIGMQNMIRAKISRYLEQGVSLWTSANFFLISAILCSPHRLLARKDKGSTLLLFDSRVENYVPK